MQFRPDSNLPLFFSALIAGVLTFMGLPVAMVVLAERPEVRGRMIHALTSAMLQSHATNPQAIQRTQTSVRRQPDAPKPLPAPAPRQTAQPQPQPKPEKPPIRIGKDDGDPIATVSWISYKDFQELIAPKARTDQPALQQQVDPVAKAPYRVDPTQGPQQVNPRPPAPQATKAVPAPASPSLPDPAPKPVNPPPPPVAQPQPILAGEQPLNKPVQQSPEKTSVAQAPKPTAAGTDDRTLPARPAIPPSPAPEAIALNPPAQQTGQLPASSTPGIGHTPPRPEQTPVEPKQAATTGNQQPVKSGQTAAPIPDQSSIKPPAPGLPAPEAKPTPDAIRDPQKTAQAQPNQPNRTPAPPTSQPARPGQNQDSLAGGSAAQTAKPTAAPRSDRESPPVSIKGGTLRITPGTVLTGKGLEIKTVMPRINIVARFVIPSNPVAKIVFDRTGQVVDAQLIKSTGYENWDGPVLASLYKWRASGSMLQQIDDRLELEMTLIFVPD